jgi:hypothetical protein
VTSPCTLPSACRDIPDISRRGGAALERSPFGLLPARTAVVLVAQPLRGRPFGLTRGSERSGPGGARAMTYARLPPRPIATPLSGAEDPALQRPSVSQPPDFETAAGGRRASVQTGSSRRPCGGVFGTGWRVRRRPCPGSTRRARCGGRWPSPARAPRARRCRSRPAAHPGWSAGAPR